METFAVVYHGLQEMPGQLKIEVNAKICDVAARIVTKYDK